MTVTITFRTPSREDPGIGTGLHERTLVTVPSALARQMADDFVQYRSQPDGTGRSKLYRYQRDGEEVLVALDFEEIIALTAAEG